MPEAVEHRQVLVLVLALATTGPCAVADRLIDAGR